MAEERRKKAVALRYDPSKDPAPRLVGKGQGHIAEKILEIAREYGQNYNSIRKNWENRGFPKHLSASQIEDNDSNDFIEMFNKSFDSKETIPENSDLIRKALGQLNTDEYRAIRLKYLRDKGLSNEEIGQILDSSADTVGRLLEKSLDKMKRYIEKQ